MTSPGDTYSQIKFFLMKSGLPRSAAIGLVEHEGCEIMLWNNSPHMLSFGHIVVHPVNFCVSHKVILPIHLGNMGVTYKG